MEIKMARKKGSKKRAPKRQTVVVEQAAAPRAPRKRRSFGAKLYKKGRSYAAGVSKQQVSMGDVVSTLAASVLAMGAARVTDSLLPDWVQSAALVVAGGVFYWAGKRRNIALALWGVAAYEFSSFALKKVDGWRLAMLDKDKTTPADAQT